MSVASRLSSAAGFAALCSFSTPLQAAPPIEAFGSLPAIAHVRLSPDGTHFSAIEPVNGREAVVVFEVHPQPGSKPMIFAVPDATATGSRWVSDDRLICFFYENKFLHGSMQVDLQQRSHAVSVSISGKPAVTLLKGSTMYLYNTSTAALAGINADDPRAAYLSLYQVTQVTNQMSRLGREEATVDLFRVDVDNNDISKVAAGSKNTAQWIMDGHGHAVGRVDQNDNLRQEEIYVADGSFAFKQRAAFDMTTGWVAGVVGLSMDGNALVIDEYGKRDKDGLDLLPFQDGAASTELFADPNYDEYAVARDPWTDRVVGASFIDDKVEYRYFDPVLAKRQKALEAALPGQSVTIASWDRKGEHYLIEAEDAHNPPGIYLFTPGDGHLEYLMNAYPSLQAGDLGDMKAYPYKSRDGLDIHSYLTFPPGKDPHKLPMVVFPHGGPGDRDRIGFDWWAQFMASRGYLVFQPNFRGSTGYGVKFRDAGDGEWGRKMQDDITDGVKKLIADGIVDPKRVCIVGASYGGYAALAGATFTPDLYACAISYAGISDIPALVGSVMRNESNDSALSFYVRKHIGDRDTGNKQMQAASPGLHADQVKAPILLLHSDNDLTVSISQSKEEATALQSAGKTVRFVNLPGDDHYLKLQDARMTVLRETEAFLAQNIGH
jgi:dipeptidyl aminopeptidase/acylaminoacyl peptidase